MGDYTLHLDATQRRRLVEGGLAITINDEYQIGDNLTVGGIGTYRVLDRSNNGFGWVYDLDGPT